MGWLALWYDLYKKCRGETITGLNGNSTLLELFAKYAPASDRNDPGAYARKVASDLFISTAYPLSWFLEDLK